MIKRATSSGLIERKAAPKLFTRTKDEIPLHRFYQEGVINIIDQKNVLQLAPDTVCLSIEIFRNFLLAEGGASKSWSKCLYLACISLAAKINEIVPPLMEDLEEVQNFFVETDEIIKMEERVLKICDYTLPLEDNILGHIWEQMSDFSADMERRCIKTLFETISDPLFFQVSPKEAAQAVILFEFPERPPRNEVSKATDCLVRRMRHISRSPKIPSFKDLNI